MKKRKGFSKVKMLLFLLVLVALGGLGCYVYFGWQSADLADVSGRRGIAIGYVDLEKKLKNGVDSQEEVTITEAELNQYIAKNVKMKQGGFMKDFAKVKGVYVDLKPDIMEVFIEREIAQYLDNDVIKTDVFKPFRHTVSMKLKIFTTEGENGGITYDRPGGTIGKAPAPRSMQLIFKSSFDQLAEHFKDEIDLGFTKMNKITIGDGFIKLDPRVKVREVTR